MQPLRSRALLVSASRNSAMAQAVERAEVMEPPTEAEAALWDILDNIDTASDIAKSDDRLYRQLVEKIVRKRYEWFRSPDGQNLVRVERK